MSRLAFQKINKDHANRVFVKKSKIVILFINKKNLNLNNLNTQFQIHFL